MKELVNEFNFVRPYFIYELGCEGLKTKDIAKSLGTEVKHVRAKLEARGFLERLKSQGFLTVASVDVHEINKIEYNEYALGVSAAKFFVAKYDSPTGDAYLTFLLNLEKAVNDYQAEINSDPMAMAMQQNLNTYLRQKQLEKNLLALSERVDNMNGDTGYRTVLAYCREHGIAVPLHIASEVGKIASKYSRENNIKIGIVPDERFGKVNSYRKDILDRLFTNPEGR
jgi:hypothetical protein